MIQCRIIINQGCWIVSRPNRKSNFPKFWIIINLISEFQPRKRQSRATLFVFGFYICLHYIHYNQIFLMISMGGGLFASLDTCVILSGCEKHLCRSTLATAFIAHGIAMAVQLAVKYSEFNIGLLVTDALFALGWIATDCCRLYQETYYILLKNGTNLLLRGTILKNIRNHNSFGFRRRET